MDDFDYGDDQDDAQRIEEKKRQLEEEALRLNIGRLAFIKISKEDWGILGFVNHVQGLLSVANWRRGQGLCRSFPAKGPEFHG